MKELMKILFTEISLLGEKYLDKQIENAINGVKEMKTVMERSGEDHQKFVNELEKTKEEKEVRQTELIEIQILTFCDGNYIRKHYHNNVIKYYFHILHTLQNTEKTSRLVFTLIYSHFFLTHQDS